MKATQTLRALLGMICLATTLAHGQAPTLKFNTDKKFKIVQFTDVHWKPGNPNSEIAAQCMNKILDAEKPDLVIYTGDLVYGKPASEALKRALEPVVSRHIPFGVTFGNHDDEQDMTRQQLYDQIKALPNNLTSTVDGLSGVTNFIIPILSADGKKNSAILYVLDSHSYSKNKQVKGYDWIKRDQIDWYVKNSSAYTAQNNNQPLPSLAFFHIPLPEYHEAVRDENAQMLGYRGEEACSPRINSGLYAAMLLQKDIMGMFVGHDHVNDYLVNWKGIALCYGRYSGGNTVYNNIPEGNGARIIELTQDEHYFKTWIRLRDGKVMQQITYPTDLQKK